MTETLTQKDLPPIPPRDPDAHKGDFGRVMIVAGSPGMTGAAALAARAALRAGAGLVTVALPRSINPILEAKCTEAMTWPLPETDAGSLAGRAAEAILEQATRFQAVAIGPGLSTHKDTAHAVRQLVSGLPVPAVVDADGLNNLAGGTVALDGAAGPRILTPHAGEMARLMDLDPEQVQSHRRETAESFAGAHGAIVALKGRGTVVTDGSRTYINQTGNPGMATAGSGDVLTGIIVALAGQGMQPLEAAMLGVYLHGSAGDRAARTLGEVSLVAGDIIDHLPGAIRAW